MHGTPVEGTEGKGGEIKELGSVHGKVEGVELMEVLGLKGSEERRELGMILL